LCNQSSPAEDPNERREATNLDPGISSRRDTIWRQYPLNSKKARNQFVDTICRLREALYCFRARTGFAAFKNSIYAFGNWRKIAAMRKSKIRTWVEQQRRHAEEDRVLLLLALSQSNWGLRPTARALGIRPTALVRLIDQLGLLALYAEHSKKSIDAVS
jgi:hypothetical protein